MLPEPKCPYRHILPPRRRQSIARSGFFTKAADTFVPSTCKRATTGLCCSHADTLAAIRCCRKLWARYEGSISYAEDAKTPSLSASHVYIKTFPFPMLFSVWHNKRRMLAFKNSGVGPPAPAHAAHLLHCNKKHLRCAGAFAIISFTIFCERRCFDVHSLKLCNQRRLRQREAFLLHLFCEWGSGTVCLPPYPRTRAGLVMHGK